MSHCSRAWLRRHLKTLAALELCNVPVQFVIPFVVLGFPLTPPNLVGFALVALLLVQGTGYWVAKRVQLAGPGIPLPGARVFAALRLLNVLLLVCGVLFALWAVADTADGGSIPGLALALSAVSEHVNYFHVQLKCGSTEDLRRLRKNGLRRAHLARDLARA
ncbi:hypothetical protein ACFP1Z_28945 [Streptomyces gamaensis]|uniref:Uncharacterized protein n=1 Tax=Streptomyces gamaensis TaxID=1763542 RepID=A0ABW0Z8L8_9ACTN